MVLKRCGLCRTDTMHYRGACMACPVQVIDVRSPEEIIQTIREGDGQLAFEIDEFEDDMGDVNQEAR